MKEHPPIKDDKILKFMLSRAEDYENGHAQYCYAVEWLKNYWTKKFNEL